MSKKKQVTETRESSRTEQQRQFEQFQEMLRQFDPAALAVYQQLQPQIASTLGQYMADPWRAGYFQQALGRTQQQAAQAGRTQMQGLLSMIGTPDRPGMAMGGIPAYMASELGRMQRGTQRAQSEALTNLLLGAGQQRLQATGMAQGYAPLQTGQTSTARGTESGVTTSEGQSTTEEYQKGGLGWLGPLAMGGLGALAGGLGWIPGIEAGWGGALKGGLGAATGLPIGQKSAETSPFLPTPMQPIGLPQFTSTRYTPSSYSVVPGGYRSPWFQ